MSPLRRLWSNAHILPLILALLLNFGLRCVYSYSYAPDTITSAGRGGDGADYLQIAYALAQTGQYGRPSGLDTVGALRLHPHPVPQVVEPDAWRPPGWTFVLAGLLKATDFNLNAVFLLRFALDAVTVLLFYLLMVLLALPARVRWIAVLLFAVQPAWLLYSASLLSEPLTLLMQVAVAVCGVLLLRRPTDGWRAAALGVVAGLSVLTHSFMILFPLLFLLGAYRLRWVAGRASLVALAFMLLTLTPWMARNMMLYHTAQPLLTTSQGNVLGMGWNQQFLATYRNTTAEAQSPDPLPPVAGQAGDPVAQSQAQTHGALEFIGANWRLLPALIGRKLVGAITPIPEVGRNGLLETGRTLAQMLAFIPLLAAWWLPKDSRPRLLILSCLGAYLAMSVITYPSLRFHFPIVWMETLSIALFITQLPRLIAQVMPWRPFKKGLSYASIQGN